MATEPNPTDQGHPGVSPEAAGAEARLGMPELLAPAGDWACAKAAVENGADAIYFGLDKFNARMRAHNFTEADVPGLMEFLHARGVRGYVTLNTLVFENELPNAEKYLRTLITAGADAAIVQDVGICRLIRQLSPDFPIHASTQMSITSTAGIDFARTLGCQLVVLARELSIAEIGQIQSSQHPPQPAMPLEVFVHGALCVAYSGQCLTSESLGGRSANRGECAQACRMPYDLISDGKSVALGDRRYLLSPQDLAGLEVLPDLVRAGVASLKIEGRLKTPEYVANITRIYRQALDALAAHPASGPARRVPRYEMEMAFSRGLYTGWFGGVNNQELVHARFGKKRGVYLGEVTGVHSDHVAVLLEGPLKPGDGVVFDAGHPEEREEGGRLYDVLKADADRCENETRHAQQVLLTFRNEAIDFSRIHVGDKLWKTSDPVLERQWRRSFEGDRPRFQRPIHIDVHGRDGVPLTVIARDEMGHVARAETSMPLVPAEKKPLGTDRLREQLGRLGGTPFKLGELTNQLVGALMVPLSELNRLRRLVVAEIDRQRRQPKRWGFKTDQPGSVPPFESGQETTGATSPRPTPNKASDAETAALIILIRNLGQLEAALRSGANTIYCDFENPKKYRAAVEIFRHWPRGPHDSRAASGQSVIDNRRCAIYVAPPRIFKPGEDWQLEQVRSCNADGYLVRNYDHLRFFAQARCVGDFSLNTSNRLAADYFLSCFGLERVTASYDLNFQQLQALLQATSPERIEVTIHQHMPMYHMEHCVFCAFLSEGRDYRDCGRPCDRHEVKLRDRVGAEHPVKADVGCRNTVFNALAQTGAEYAGRLQALGVRHFRLEFLNETSEEVERTISKYRRLFAGEITGTEVWKDLKLCSQLGVTRGQLAGH